MNFATRAVTGWKDRHLNPLKVVDALRTREDNGFDLTLDERTFVADVHSLQKRYAK